MPVGSVVGSDDYSSPMAGRKAQGEGGTLTDGACHIDRSLVLIGDNIVRNAQALSRPFADLFGREEWIEYLVDLVGGNTVAGIGDLDKHSRLFGCGADGNLSFGAGIAHPFGNGLRRVDDDIQENLIKRSGIAFYRRFFRIQIEVDIERTDVRRFSVRQE